MLDLEMTTHDGCAVLRIAGPITSAAAVDTIGAAMSFVPIDDHLVVDLRAVTVLSPRCASSIRAALVERMHCAETVIVSTRPEVTMQLVLHGADVIAPVLASIDDAFGIVRLRSGQDVAPTNGTAIDDRAFDDRAFDHIVWMDEVA